MTIRPARAADAARIAEIYAHYVATSAVTFDETEPAPDEFADRIAASNLPFLVAERDGAVEGYAYLAPYKDRSAYRHTAECSVYVADEARGRGTGRRLLERLIAEAPGAGVREVVAIIGVTGDPASIALHRSCGFAEKGTLERVGYKQGRWWDTVLMQRSVG